MPALNPVVRRRGRLGALVHRFRSRLPRALPVRRCVPLVLLAPVGLLGALVAGRWAPLRDSDVAVTDATHAWAVKQPAMVDAMNVWTLVFSPMALRGAALLLAIWLFRRRDTRAAWWVIITMAAGGLIAALVKLVVQRDRPSFLDPVAEATGYAFPSGHAANAALAAGVFLLILRRHRRLLWPAAAVVTVITGLTRIGLGVHWTSDVVAGWFLGAATVAAAATALHPSKPPRR